MRERARRGIVASVPTDHHSEYLASAVAALTPQGHQRVDELLEQLGEAVADREWLVRFTRARQAEADLGRLGVVAEDGEIITAQERDVLIAGFQQIRDQEPLDDVARWAGAVVALLEDTP
jgi:hypothetical protein